MDRTPRELENRPVDPQYTLLPWWLAAIFKGREAWQDRQVRRRYEGPTARAERLGPWACSVCGSEARGDRCQSCGADR